MVVVAVVVGGGGGVDVCGVDVCGSGDRSCWSDFH